MLPMIVTVCLSKGALVMSRKRVIVKRLGAIQNFGAMDVLCTDKTGTLTMDRVILEKHCDVVREHSDNVLRTAYLNSYFQTGLKNVLDRAILRIASCRWITPARSMRFPSISAARSCRWSSRPTAGTA